MSWYFSKNLKPAGPHSLSEMREKIHRGEIGPQDLVSNKDDGEWKAAIAWKEFEQGLFPAFQNLSEEMAAADWVVLTGQRQQGPFSAQQVLRMIQEHKWGWEQGQSVHVWKSGLSGWVKITDRPEFMSAFNPEAAFSLEMK